MSWLSPLSVNSCLHTKTASGYVKTDYEFHIYIYIYTFIFFPDTAVLLQFGRTFSCYSVSVHNLPYSSWYGKIRLFWAVYILQFKHGFMWSNKRNFTEVKWKITKHFIDLFSSQFSSSFILMIFLSH